MCEAVTDGDSDPPHLHVVKDFEEGEGHPTTDDHLIHLIQHVIDQLDLIFHLCSESQPETSVLTRDVCDIRINKITQKTASAEGRRATETYDQISGIKRDFTDQLLRELTNNHSTDNQFWVEEATEYV